MEDKETIPLGMDVHLEVSEPFVAYTPKNKVVIIQIETLYNAHGDILHHCEICVDPSPTEEEIFKVNLKNPQKERQIAWGMENPVKGKTVGGSRLL